MGILVNIVLWAAFIGWKAPRNKLAWSGYVAFITFLVLVRVLDVPILNNCVVFCHD